MLKNLVDLCVTGLVFWLCGYGLAFGAGSAASVSAYVGTDKYLLIGAGVADNTAFFFHYAFAATAATIVSGAMAERIRLGSYAVFTAVLVGLVYPPVARSVWMDYGWAAQLGAVDFAGGGVVHLLGGTAALVGVLMVGPRLGKYDNVGVTTGPTDKSSVNARILGVLLLWMAWFSFNVGSQRTIIDDGSADGSAIAAHIAVVTCLAACAGGMAGLAWSSARFAGIVLIDDVGNGMLGGLVTITAGCHVLEPWAAVLCASLGGFLTCLLAAVLDVKFKIDDPVAAIAVHFGGGLWSLLSLGLMHPTKGLLRTASFSFIGSQIAFAAATIVWATTLSALIFVGLHVTIGLRVDRTEEELGLDLTHHSARKARFLAPAEGFQTAFFHNDIEGDAYAPGPLAQDKAVSFSTSAHAMHDAGTAEATTVHLPSRSPHHRAADAAAAAAEAEEAKRALVGRGNEVMEGEEGGTFIVNSQGLRERSQMIPGVPTAFDPMTRDDEDDGDRDAREAAREPLPRANRLAPLPPR